MSVVRNSCIICVNDIVDNRNLFIPSCVGRAENPLKYHKGCIKNWYNTASKCINCAKSIHDEDYQELFSFKERVITKIKPISVTIARVGILVAGLIFVFTAGEYRKERAAIQIMTGAAGAALIFANIALMRV